MSSNTTPVRQPGSLAPAQRAGGPRSASFAGQIDAHIGRHFPDLPSVSRLRPNRKTSYHLRLAVLLPRLGI